jgi:hypothetical protein
VELDFAGAVGHSRFALHWGPVLLTDFQMDRQGTKGRQAMEMANTTVYAWLGCEGSGYCRSPRSRPSLVGLSLLLRGYEALPS